MIPTKPLPFSSHTLPLDFCKHFLRVQSHLFFCRQQPFRYSVFAFKFSQYLRSSLCRIKFKEISPGAGRRRRRTEDGRQRTVRRAIRQSSAASGRSARDKVTVRHTAFYETAKAQRTPRFAKVVSFRDDSLRVFESLSDTSGQASRLCGERLRDKKGISQSAQRPQRFREKQEKIDRKNQDAGLSKRIVSI